MFEGFHKVLYKRRSDNESLKNLRMCFSAEVAKCNSIYATMKLPPCITALMLLSNASIEHLQRVLCLHSAAPNGTVFTYQSSKDEVPKSVLYKKLASVVKQR